MDKIPQQPSSGVLTERHVADELGLERVEVYLLASKLKLGKFDTITHLLTFTEAEVDEIARRLEVARRKRREPAESDRKSIPEPNSE